jgi:hypothetical protein
MKKLISILIALGLLFNIAPTVSAKPKGDWDSVKALANSSNTSIAVKTKTGGTTHYGLLDSVDDSNLTIRIAGWDDMSSQKITIKRAEVARVWRARLRFEDNVGKAVLIGAGTGVGVAFIVAGVLASKNEADPPTGAALFPLIGAGAGAVAGMFWKKKHRKLDLVYSI